MLPLGLMSEARVELIGQLYGRSLHGMPAYRLD